MRTILIIVQFVSALFLVVVVLLSQRGTGLSATFGGEGNVYRTKRGLEKVLFIVTIGLAVVFFGTALALLFVEG